MEQVRTWVLTAGAVVLALLILLTGWKAPVRYGLAALCCSIGGAIKPSVYILLIAALLLGAIRFLFQKKNAVLWKRGLCVLAVVVLGILPGVALEKGAVTLLAGSPAPDEALGMAHYLMIGLDDQYWGGHSIEDLAFSDSFATAKERTRANLERAQEELRSRTLRKSALLFREGVQGLRGRHLCLQQLSGGPAGAADRSAIALSSEDLLPRRRVEPRLPGRDAVHLAARAAGLSRRGVFTGEGIRRAALCAFPAGSDGLSAAV